MQKRNIKAIQDLTNFWRPGTDSEEFRSLGGDMFGVEIEKTYFCSMYSSSVLTVVLVLVRSQV